MTTNTYRIDAKKQQDIYAQLQGIAAQHQDNDVIVGAKEKAALDSLSETDAIEAKNSLGDEKARVTVMDQTRFVNVFVSRTEALRVIYDALRARDANQDGKIDKTYLTQDLNVTVSEESSAVTDASWERLVEKYKESVFDVRVYHGDTGEYSIRGTGFIYKRFQRSEGPGYTYHILTNAHVAAEKYNKESNFELYDVEDQKIRVKNVKFVGADVNADVAVLEFNSPTLLEECPLATRVPRRNEAVMEIGNTEGEGVIAVPGTVVDLNSGMSRYDYTGYDNYPFQIYKMFIHTRGGNSGSPVFNSDGEVMLQHHAGEGGTSPYHYGIPSDRLSKTYGNIIAHRDNGGVVYSDWGIYPVALSPMDRKQLLADGFTGQGVKINKVYPDSPAARNELKAGDIVLSVNGKSDTVDVSDESGLHRFLTTVLESTPEKTVKLEVYRQDEGRISFDLVPEESLFKQPEVYETSYEFNAVELTRDKRRLWNLSDEIQGVWIYAQNRDQYDNPSHPIQGFLYENQIITKVNGVPTPDVNAFQEAYESAIIDKTIILTIYSGPAAYRDDDGGVGSEFTVYL